MSVGVEVRIPLHLWGRLWDEVRRPGPDEPVVFGLVSHGQTSDGTLVLVRDIIVPPTTAFVRSTTHGAKWTGAYNISLLNEAMEHRLGILIFHYHAGTDQVRMSQDDEQSARELLPIFQMVAPGRPHGSIVLGESSASGLILLPDASHLLKDFRLRFFSDAVRTFPQTEVSPSDLVLHRRQPLVDGAVTRSRLANMVVAVVGLSGGGTQVATQLAGLGIGEIIGIDAQRVTRDNLLATDEFGWADILLRRRKTAALRSKVWWINRQIRFTAVDALVPEKPAIDALKRADLIVGCVNNLNARADVQEIAWRYCIPYVDIGLGLYPFDPDDGLSEIAAIGGNVCAAVPGGACLWCTGFLTDEKVQRESGGGDRSYLRTAIAARNGRNSAAYVATFNGVLAGLAVSDVLQLILGYAPALAVRKQYDALSGTVSEVVVKKDPQCSTCSSVLAAGDPLWQ
ncbi:MAG: ThiF family adenylyltransferase [Acidobacteriota bacterium]